MFGFSAFARAPDYDADQHDYTYLVKNSPSSELAINAWAGKVREKCKKHYQRYHSEAEPYLNMVFITALVPRLVPTIANLPIEERKEFNPAKWIQTTTEPVKFTNTTAHQSLKLWLDKYQTPSQFHPETTKDAKRWEQYYQPLTEHLNNPTINPDGSVELDAATDLAKTVPVDKENKIIFHLLVWLFELERHNKLPSLAKALGFVQPIETDGGLVYNETFLTLAKAHPHPVIYLARQEYLAKMLKCTKPLFERWPELHKTWPFYQCAISCHVDAADTIGTILDGKSSGASSCRLLLSRSLALHQNIRLGSISTRL